MGVPNDDRNGRKMLRVCSLTKILPENFFPSLKTITSIGRMLPNIQPIARLPSILDLVLTLHLPPRGSLHTVTLIDRTYEDF